MGADRDAAIAAVAARLEDPSGGVRKAAVAALPRLAPRNHVPTVRAVTACFEHWDPAVRLAAIEALELLVDVPRARGICEVKRCTILPRWITRKWWPSSAEGSASPR